jgi:hypothetical protein
MSSRRWMGDSFGRAEEVHRRFHRRHFGNHPPPVFVGILLIALGVVFLLDNLNIIESRTFFRTFWPALFIAWGAGRLMYGRGGEQVLGGVAVLGGGVLLGNRLFGWDVNIAALLWPLILIALGIAIVTRGAWGRRPVKAPALPGGPAMNATDASEAGTAHSVSANPSADVSSTVKEFAFMAGVDRRSISQSFRGGDVSAFMGSVELDLRECRAAGEEVSINLSVVMGNAAFRIPRDWAVDSRVANILASFEDRSEPPVAASPKRLVLVGSAILGGVEIRN